MLQEEEYYKKTIQKVRYQVNMYKINNWLMFG